MRTDGLLPQFARFLVVGLSNTGVSFVVYAVLVGLGVPAPPAGALAFAAGAANGYVWNRRWTFRVAGALWRYVVVQAAGAGLAAGLLWLVVTVGGLDHLLGYAVTLPLVTASTFAANRGWAFST